MTSLVHLPIKSMHKLLVRQNQAMVVVGGSIISGVTRHSAHLFWWRSLHEEHCSEVPCLDKAHQLMGQPLQSGQNAVVGRLDLYFWKQHWRCKAGHR